MKYTIFYPTSLSNIDPVNDNVDVCLRLDDGTEYVLVVATPNNLEELMCKNNVSYLKPGLPFLIVKRIEHENICKLIEDLMNDEELLKIYGADCASP